MYTLRMLSYPKSSKPLYSSESNADFQVMLHHRRARTCNHGQAKTQIKKARMVRFFLRVDQA